MAGYFFCQNCGRAARGGQRSGELVVCAACLQAVRRLPGEAVEGQVSPNQRLVRIEGQWVGRYCFRCGGFCPAGVGEDGLCKECHAETQPGCSVCGREPAWPLLGRGVRMCEFHTTLQLAEWERTRPVVVDPRGMSEALSRLEVG